MGDPVGAARHTRESLKDDGHWLLVEPFANDNVADNLNPIGRVFYSASTLICTPASLSQEVGAGLGAQAGEAKLREVAEAAGFSSFRLRHRNAVQPRARRTPVASHRKLRERFVTTGQFAGPGTHTGRYAAPSASPERRPRTGIPMDTALDRRPFAGHRAWSLRSDRKLKSFLPRVLLVNVEASFREGLMAWKPSRIMIKGRDLQGALPKHRPAAVPTGLQIARTLAPCMTPEPGTTATRRTATPIRYSKSPDRDSVPVNFKGPR